jgi:CheY-like chemotaxis protein
MKSPTKYKFEIAPVEEILKKVKEINGQPVADTSRSPRRAVDPLPESPVGHRPVKPALERRSPAKESAGKREKLEKGSSASPQKHAILIVDDERPIADTLALILQAKGYATAVAYDAKTALRIYDEIRPQLVLSDVVMPGMNGVRMAIEMRRRGGCPILLLSGQAVTSDLLREAREQGHAFELLMKPIHPTALLKRIAMILNAPVVSRTGMRPRVSPPAIAELSTR